ncbi:enoyl-[acyl-carrier-protein] reductase [NADH] [Lentzea sp. NBRC 105346]|uniref:enoyl-ACP reductase FabV n=1 Tax=Lentzea sp. NBRC 105346 TaxID=3032205 RepID=UPI0024A4BB17|nr:enoyl-ACP reductase FabV [Lentzea sp. NBRC 105346]GLZ32250.1 enoyl-[acyl-carrier-protein] reductase [NADH] [Lentzea sp. NBRC 105346]
MIVEPVLRRAVCVTAHPDGCAERVRQAIDQVKVLGTFNGPARVLVIGSSAGLGLSTRIAAAFGGGASTIGVCLERPGTPGRTGTAGWYNSAALEEELAASGHFGRTVIGDAFADRTKAETVSLIRSTLGQVDLVVYSLAAPTRTDPVTGHVHRSSIKTIGTPYTDKSFDADTGEVRVATMPAATDPEIAQTVAVMGGDDWARWITALQDGDVLAPGADTVAFTYVGGEFLAETYRLGTLGRAKEHLEATARLLDDRLTGTGGRAHAVAARALITQASRVMPFPALYTLLLSKVTRDRGLAENLVDQAHRLLAGFLYGPGPLRTDEERRIRLDDRELLPEVQADLRRRWELVDSSNLALLGDLDGYLRESLALHGFGVPGVDYLAETDPVRDIPGVVDATT